MANYNEISVAGNVWTRCSSVYIGNNYGVTPTITFGEQQLIALENLAPMVVNSNTSCSTEFDAAANIAILDPATGNPTGQTVTQQELYNIVYSLYIATAKARDASQTSTI
jgi:hypothetical protein